MDNICSIKRRKDKIRAATDSVKNAVHFLREALKDGKNDDPQIIFMLNRLEPAVQKLQQLIKE